MQFPSKVPWRISSSFKEISLTNMKSVDERNREFLAIGLRQVAKQSGSRTKKLSIRVTLTMDENAKEVCLPPHEKFRTEAHSLSTYH